MARKRGRPKNKSLDELVPHFNNDEEIIDYLIQESLILNALLSERAKKKNNIKSPSVARAKVYELKTAIDSLNVTKSLLHEKNVLLLKNKFDSFEFGLIENNEEAKFEFEKLNDEFEKIRQN